MCCVAVLVVIGWTFPSRADEPKDGLAIENGKVIHLVDRGDCEAGEDSSTEGSPSDPRPMQPMETELISQLAIRLGERDHFKAMGEVSKLLNTRSTANLEPLVDPLFKLSGWGGIARQESWIAETYIVRIGEPAIPYLTLQLISIDGHNRRVAAELVTRIGPADAALAHLLCPLLADSDVFVRRAAIDGLGVVGPAASDSVDDLDRIATNDSNLFLRVCARIALIQIAGPSEERVQALATFLEMKDELEAGPRDEKRKSDFEQAANHAADALGEMGPKAQAATPILLVALKDPTMRHVAARTLGQIGSKSPEAIAVLIDILQNDSHYEHRRSAAADLGDFGPAAKDAIPVLREELQRDPNPGWYVAANTLGKIGGEDVVPILTKAIEHGNGDIRLASMRALGDLGTLAQPAITALEKARHEDPFDYNHAAAAEALLKIRKASEP